MVLLGDGFLGLKFKVGFLLSDTSDFLRFLLFSSGFDLRFSFLLGGILLLVKVAVRCGSLFSESESSLLVSGLAEFEGTNEGLGSLVGSEEFLSAKGSDIRVELDHDTQVLQRVLLSGSLGSGLLRRVDLALDLARGNKAVEIRVSDKRSR